MKSLDAYTAYLAEKHKNDTDQIAAALALGMYPLWNLVKFDALDASMLTWLPAVLPLVKTAYLQSQRVTAVFAQNVRFASLPTAEPLPIGVPDVEEPPHLSPGAFQMPELGIRELEDIFDTFPQRDVATSLTIEADYKTKRAMPGPEEELMQNALVRSSGAGIRQAINGSRGVTNNIVSMDKKILGYARVTDSNPCYFCALLASRGAVYSKDSFIESDASFTANPNGAKNLPEGFTKIAKVHNSCRCTLRPVYTKSSAMDAAAKYWRDNWNRIYKQDPDRGNAKMLQDFREWHDNNPFQGNQFDLHTLRQDLLDRRDSLLDAGFDPTSPQVKWAEQQQHLLSA